jgi:peptidyl-dipeptidase Dcp
MTLLEDSYKDFVRGGANLSDEDKALYSKWSEELSLTTLQFSKNVLAATNAYTLHVTDSADLAGLPEYVKTMAAETAAEKGLEGCPGQSDRREIYLLHCCVCACG